MILGNKQSEFDAVQEKLSKLQQSMQAEAVNAAKQVINEQARWSSKILMT